MDRLEVYKRLDSERAYQQQKWGEHSHSIGDWLVLMQYYMAQATVKFAKSAENKDTLNEMRKAAALAVACFEQHGVPEREVK